MYKQIGLKIVRALLVIIGFIFLYFFTVTSFTYAYPFIIAIIFSFLLHPSVTFIEKRLKTPRPIATILVIILFLFIFFSLSILLVTELIQGMIFLGENLPNHYHFFLQYLQETMNFYVFPFYQKLSSIFQTLHVEQQMAIEKQLEQFINTIAIRGSALLKNFFIKLSTLLVFLPSSVTIFTFTILATFFITNDWPHLKRKLKNGLPLKLKKRTNHVVFHFKIAIMGYVKAQFILMIISAVTIYCGLLLLNINHALTIAFLTGIVDLLPLIGTGVIFIPWIIYLLVTANYSLTIGLSILYIIVILSRQIIEPKIMSANIGIHPLLGLFILFMSIQIWGVSGIILTPIIMIIFVVFLRAGIVKQIWDFIQGA